MGAIEQTMPFGVARPEPATELPRGTIVDHFVIDEKIGAGGMATVYTATHPVLGKRAAIKVLALEHCANQQAVRHFLQEARTLSLVRHPNLVDVFGFGQLRDGRSYFLMDLLEGETLIDEMSRAPMSLERICDLTLQICDALQAAHDHNIVHLDLKPENIFLVPLRRGRTCVKLLDFGIARLIGAPGQAPERRVFTGTPTYASPEQCMARAEIDTRSDLYSLGVVLYEMTTGRAPFKGASHAEVLTAHVRELPRPPRRLRPELPEGLERLILRLLYKEPARRPSLDEFRDALAEIATAERARTTVVPRRRWPRLVAAGAIAVGCALFTARAISERRIDGRAQVLAPPRTLEEDLVALHAEVPELARIEEKAAAPPAPPPRHHPHRARLRVTRPQAVAPNSAAVASGDDYLIDEEGRRR